MRDLLGMEVGEPGEADKLPRAPLVLTPPGPRGKHYVEPRGYAGMPGTGPAGQTCHDCAHYRTVAGGSRTFPKCALNRAKWTGGRASDILARAPACSRFEESEDGGIMDGTNRTTSGAIGQP